VLDHARNCAGPQGSCYSQATLQDLVGVTDSGAVCLYLLITCWTGLNSYVPCHPNNALDPPSSTSSQPLPLALLAAPAPYPHHLHKASRPNATVATTLSPTRRPLLLRVSSRFTTIYFPPFDTPNTLYYVA
jgi:hypothetical protein